MLREYDACKEIRVPFVLNYDADDFTSLVKRLKDDVQGSGMPAGFVPHSTFWLVKDGSYMIGVSNLRHRLNDRLEREGGHIGLGIRPSERGKGYGSLLLQKTLIRAKAMGMDRVLLTCNKDNHPSARVIVKNGGVLDSEEETKDGRGITQRYWIRTYQIREENNGEFR